MKTVLIRADSSNRIGTGHIMRTLILANQFKNCQIFFATRNLKNNINHRIIEKGFNILNLESNEPKELIECIKAYKIDMIVIDHYDIDYFFEKKIKINTNVEIFVLDDNYNRHYCDIILNHNIYAKKELYHNLVPSECEIRCGSEYTLLREEFLDLKNIPKKNNKNESKKILITMGGADSQNLSISIVESLKDLKNIYFTVISTRANKNLKELKKFSKINHEKVNLVIETNQIASMMHSSDLIICTPSVTSNECYHLNVPFIAIKTEENQKYMTEFLKNSNYHILESFNKEKLRNEFLKIINC